MTWPCSKCDSENPNNLIDCKVCGTQNVGLAEAREMWRRMKAEGQVLTAETKQYQFPESIEVGTMGWSCKDCQTENFYYTDPLKCKGCKAETDNPEFRDSQQIKRIIKECWDFLRSYYK